MTVTECFRAKKLRIIRCKLMVHETSKVHAFVCLTIEIVLLLNSSHNNGLYQVSKLLCSKVLSTNMSGLGHSTVQLVDKADSKTCTCLVAHTDANLQLAACIYKGFYCQDTTP